MRAARFLVLTLPLAAVPAQTVLIAAAPPPWTAAVRLEPGRGLVVEPWSGGAVVVADGCDPRFAADGRLFIDCTTDDGRTETGRATWVLEPGSRRLRPPAPAETAPPFRNLIDQPAGVAVRVCIDAGHGGTDPGAVGINGLEEKAVNLDVCLRLQTLLQLDTANPTGGGEWDVLMTRTGDQTVTLAQRTNAANAFGAASFLSVHMNSFTSSTANGTETYCYPGTETGAAGRLRNRVLAAGLAAWGLVNRGAKTANFYVLRNTTMPAALHEGGFITSPIDHPHLASAAEREKLAVELLFAVQEHHGFNRFDPRGPATGLLRGVLYDQAGGTGARLPGELVALSDGRYTFTDATGYFQFTLPAQTWTYAATAPGFDPVALQRAVPAGGEIWGSIGLPPNAGVPGLRLSPQSPPAGQPFSLRLEGTPGTPAASLWSVLPSVPPLDLRGLGLGFGWIDAGAFVAIGLGTVPAAGVLDVQLRVQGEAGAILYLQGVSWRGSGLRLSNGAALELR